MRKRMFVCFFIFTISVFHFSIPNVVFGQPLANQVFTKYKQTSLHQTVGGLFPDFLKAFADPEIQPHLNPGIIQLMFGRPDYLGQSLKVDDKFIVHMKTNYELQNFLKDEQLQILLLDPKEIGILADLIEKLPVESEEEEQDCEPELRRAKTLGIVSGNHQSGEVDEPLAQPFVVGVLDQNGKPLQGTAVTFTVTAGNKRLSETTDTTNVYGQAQMPLTLGSDPVPYLVEASVAAKDSLNSVQLTQTFTATADAPPPPEEPELVVPVRSSTEEPPMYWIAGNTIYYRPTGGGKETFHAPQSGTLTGGLAVDMGGGKVYWTEKETNNTGRVRRANLDKSNVKTFKEIDAVPRNIAVGTDKNDQRWVYWTTSNKRIHRINVNVEDPDFQGKFMKFPKSRTPPNHIAFDEGGHKLYWTEMGRIRGVAANGKGKRDIIVENLGELGGIAVADGVVYWTERTDDNLGKVGFRDLTGQNDKKPLAVLGEIIPVGIAVDPVGESVYWTTDDGGIQSVPLTGAIQTVVTSVRGAGLAAGIALGGTAMRQEIQAAQAAPSLSSVGSVENTLLANYPNPFNPETWIPYQLSASADVSVSIYAVDGRLVRRLDLGHQVAGVYRSRSRAAYWDGRNEFGERVASGLYFYTLTASDFTATRKMLIRK